MYLISASDCSVARLNWPSCVVFVPHAAVFVQGSLTLFHDVIKKLPPFYENTTFNLFFSTPPSNKDQYMEQNLDGHYL